MLEIDDIMQKFCDAGAQSVCRYVMVAGEHPWTMPEYFMPAFVLDHLGNEITATLETSFDTLVEWNNDIRKRRGLPEQLPDHQLLRLAEQLGGRRVDLVLFEGEEERKPKDQQDFLAFVEFKKGWIDADRDPDPGRVSDRDKLLMLLAHLDTCRWGIVCGWANQAHVQWQKESSIKSTRDRWYERKIEIHEGFSSPLFFCARVFERLSDDRSIEELLSALPVAGTAP